MDSTHFLSIPISLRVSIVFHISHIILFRVNKDMLFRIMNIFLIQIIIHVSERMYILFSTFRVMHMSPFTI